ncbi:LysM peptidoglycan-binding domain-containing protein [Geodermatophilus sp. DF01-2]|uniref:LysM peptidoglycan-binding domain-containing protein n=1 Tax=Geodermatophilus sp. DF01-2 TaxID=2559610 RepID=UPI00107461DE|nr:LysM peptidoglycan-binding domain-containing protein [Geodermatophilus sp. DF01_2]TFV52593.1 LysM peptidoglycan-binding domain-containing protein [Geodermatophilus sp. DF01_2]
MASVRQAVLEFDAAVQVPWRPLLGSGVAGRAAGSGRPARSSDGPGLPGSGPRVAGHLRPVAHRAAPSVPRAAGPAVEAPRTRRDPVRPAGRPVPRPGVAAVPVRGGCVAGKAPLRLTRRGRRLLIVLVAAVAVGVAVLVHTALDAGPGSDLRLAGGSGVVVEPGDTVWSIAAELAGADQDVRVVVDAIEELNDLEASVVVPGQVLRLP